MTSGSATAPDKGVLLVHSSDEMYGADRILLEVVTALRELSGRPVEVWLPAAEPGALSAELVERGVPIRQLELPILRRSNASVLGLAQLVRASAATLRALRRRRPCTVYLMTSACLPVAPLARLAGARSVLVHVQEMWSRFDRLALRIPALFCTAAIAISQPVADASRLRRRPPIVVVENGVTVPEPAELVGSAELPASSADRHPRYVVASRWNGWKGHRTLLAAWESAGCPGELTILGAPPPSGGGVDVPALVDELLSRPETVRVVGQVDSIADYLAEADGLILPSDRPEPFGLVIIEAFAQARPAIASRGGGPAHIVTDGVDGWLYELGSATALAALLRRLDLRALHTAGQRAVETYAERYTPQGYRERIASTVEGLIRES